MNEALDLGVSVEMKRTYVGRRRDDLAKLRSALGAGDYDEVKLIGHRLAGSAGNFGFGDLEKIAREMESLDEKSERSRVLGLTLQFELWVNSTTAALGC